MKILLICSYIFVLCFLFVYLPVQIYLRKKHKKDVKRPTYSYKSLWVNFLKYLPWVLAIISLIFILTNDIEITMALAVFILSCYVAGHLKMLLLEYQRKRAGGNEKHWEK
jgi:amino acid transporter